MKLCQKCGKKFRTKSSYDNHTNILCVRNIKDYFSNISMDNEQNEVSFRDVCVSKPILKWVGGKSQIIEHIMSLFPKNIHNYYEIFLGGGSVMLALLSCVKYGFIHLTGKVFVYDLNEPLIYVYINIQKNPELVYDSLTQMIREYSQCPMEGEQDRNAQNILDAMKSKESYYYWIRKSYNSLDADDKKTYIGSAMFIFLNKTCFRGLFRTGPKGFNVPFGNYKMPEIINKEHLYEVHHLIKDVVFACSDFMCSLELPKSENKGDFIYLDPPYVPETNTSFVNYNEGGFDMNCHRDLFRMIHVINEKGYRFMMSNSDVPIVREEFKTYKQESVLCKRSINSKKPDSKTSEIIVSNY